MFNKIGKIHKWSYAEMTSNEDGKTSASGTMGSFTILIGLIGFLFSLAMAAFFNGTAEYVYISVMVISIGAGLLGYRKRASKDIISLVTNKKPINIQESEIINDEEETEDFLKNKSDE